jgi:hypothetical protein
MQMLKKEARILLMKNNIAQNLAVILLFCSLNTISISAKKELFPRTVHAFVALCDNQNQGIVPVSALLGDGTKAETNLYWGAMYGVKSYFMRNPDWTLIASIKRPSNETIERCVFQHKKSNTYLVADAYQGRLIETAILNFLKTISGELEAVQLHDGTSHRVILDQGESPDLVVYVGHNGLMDFTPASFPQRSERRRNAIILACKSADYFEQPLKKAGGEPLLWTTNLMAPEAYTLKAALDGWILGEDGRNIRLRAAYAYHSFQKCNLRSAQNLFKSGW